VSAPAPIPFIDLKPGEDHAAVQAAIDRVVTRGWFVLGPEVDAFEREFAAASNAAFAVGVGNGTDAIALALRALGIGTGDEVIVPALTAGYTALAVIATGATPVIVDVEPHTLTIDPAACAAAVTSRTRAIVPVHLYGQPADMESIRSVASRHSLAMVEDCCQAHLATERGVAVGTRAEAAAFSFYPTKNLGALGDGGAVITGSGALASRIRRLRNGGQQTRAHHVEAGVNSRLDDLQAAVLRARLPLLPQWTIRRRALAARYRQLLPASLRTIRERDAGHVYHLFPVLTAEREALQTHLSSAGIETMVHYPVALTDQPAFAPLASQSCPVAAAAASELLSLPLSPRLTDADVVRVADAVAAFVKGHRLA
jgi:dTDP-3-amino-3,4,6-trideoxy-alpha-D-glucose transaminase